LYEHCFMYICIGSIHTSDSDSRKHLTYYALASCSTNHSKL